MKTSISQVKDQGSQILLLAQLLREYPDLPAVEFHFSTIYNRLDISVHDDLLAFEAWRVALGLGEPEPASYADSSWLKTEGRFADAGVYLVGYAKADSITAYGQVAA